jgi:hypothetical protein
MAAVESVTPGGAARDSERANGGSRGRGGESAIDGRSLQQREKKKRKGKKKKKKKLKDSEVKQTHN